MFSIKNRKKLLFIINVLLAKLYLFNIATLAIAIANQCRLFLQSRGLASLLFYDDFRRLMNINIFLCLLIPLALLVTSTTYATTEYSNKITASQPVTMSLNHPNNLANYLAILEGESVVELHYFLKMMMQAEVKEYENNCIDGSRVNFNQNEYLKFHGLYGVLSLRYCQGTSFTGFMKHILFNEPVQMITRPLLQAMLKLCNDYNDVEGMTIGNMLVDVEEHEHIDKNIITFLHYKANDAKAHYKNFYNENDASTKCSAKNNSGVSWFRRCKQQLGNYTKRIVKNMADLTSKAMCKAPFIGLMMSPVGAPLTCDGERIPQLNICTGWRYCEDNGDEQASECCEGGVKGINSTTRMCVNSNKYNTKYKHENFFVCPGKNDVMQPAFMCDNLIYCTGGYDERTTGTNAPCLHCGKNNGGRILRKLACDGEKDCTDGLDEKALLCCKGGEKGIDGQRTCVKKDTQDTILFVCKNNDVISKEYLCDGNATCVDGSDELISGKNPACFDCGKNNGGYILSELACDGEKDCTDGLDEKALFCCKGGEKWIDIQRSCVKKNTQDTILFVCKNNDVISKEYLCDGNATCVDGSDELINGKNPACLDCGRNNGGYILSELGCDGENDCTDGLDEHASYCCEDGLQGINSTTRICEKKGDSDIEYFVCKDDNIVIKKAERCDGAMDCRDGSDEYINGINPICFDCDENINGANPICFKCPGNNGTFIVSELPCNYESINGTGMLLYPAAALATVAVAAIPIICCWVYDGVYLKKTKWIKAPLNRVKQLFRWCCGHKKLIDNSKNIPEIELCHLEKNTLLKPVDKNVSAKIDRDSESTTFLPDN